MTNPTLIAQDTAWRGWTFDELEERLLASRGLTADATTGRTEATTAERTAAKDALRQAINFLAAEFPSLWDVRTYSTTWTSGDHTISLPSNVMAILGVTFDGYNMAPLNRVSYAQALRNDDAGGDIADAGRPAYYRVTGFSDEGSGSRDWRVAMRLHPQPATTYAGDTVTVEYIALGLDVETASTDPISLFPFLQSWVLQRSKEVWAAENGDSAIQSVAEAERDKIERGIGRWIEGTKQLPSKMRHRYPKPSTGRRYRL